MVKIRGFTLVELLVVLAIIGTLLTWVGVRLNNKVTVAREQTLRHNLSTLRDGIDQFRADKGKFPQNLAELVETGYLRKLPVDPFTESSDSWATVTDSVEGQGGIADVHSGADAEALSGEMVSTW